MHHAFRHLSARQFATQQPSWLVGQDALRIAEGALLNLADGCLFVGDGGERCLFRGVRYSTRGVRANTAYQANGVIRISERWLSDAQCPFGLHDFAHEYGHYLQQRDYGWWDYYSRVAWDSITHLGDDHYARPYEADATRRGAAYLAEHLRLADVSSHNGGE